MNDQEGKTTSSKVLKPVVKPSVSIKSTSVLKQKSTLKSSVVPDRPALNGKVTRVVRPALAVVRESWDDLDAIDEHDIGMASEYVVEIFEYMRTLELTTLPDSNYMADQTELTWSMRSVLVEWLVEVHMKFSLLPETLYLAINILDRFLSRRVVSLPKLQLVGITAMFIACKYEEIINPGLTNFVRLADNGYTEEEVLKSELYVLSVLDYGLHFPNPMNFLRRVSKAEQYDLHSRTLGKYLMEVTLLSEKFVGIPASMIVAACTYFARKVIGKELWVSTILLLLNNAVYRMKTSNIMLVITLWRTLFA